MKVYDEAQPGVQMVGGGSDIPIAALACKRCFFFFPFVWVPIRRKIDGDK
jgi:hypothetical protein